MADFSKPLLVSADRFDLLPQSTDPVEVAAAGHRVAELLVRGAWDRDDTLTRDRILHLADTEGLGTIATLWSPAPADSLPGALWRLYVLRTWVHREPSRASREFGAGRTWAPVDEALAGVEDPPGPKEVIELVDAVVRGVVGSSVDVAFDRAAAFAHIVAIGRAHLDSSESPSGARLMDTAAELRRAAVLERAGRLA